MKLVLGTKSIDPANFECGMFLELSHQDLVTKNIKVEELGSRQCYIIKSRQILPFTRSFDF